MTLHCVIRYAGKNGLAEGYVLGTDSAGETGRRGMRGRRRFETNKGIFGRNTIGICTGSFPFPVSWRLAKSLDGLFDGIEKGRSYADIPVLAKSGGYAIMIAKQGPPVSLYMVSNTSNHCARLVDIIKGQKTAKLWYSNRQGYVSMKLEQSISCSKAIKHVQQILTEAVPKGYRPGVIRVFKVNRHGTSILGPVK